MKIDTLKQYAKLRQQLLAEKSDLEVRLREINQVLEPDSSLSPVAAATESVPRRVNRRGRRGSNKLSLRQAIAQALSARGPLGRKELAEAVQQVGYVSKAKDPLASMGVLLYAKNSPFKKKEGKFYLPDSAAPTGTEKSNGTAEPRKRKTMSPEAKAKIAAAQRARWARHRRSLK